MVAAMLMTGLTANCLHASERRGPGRFCGYSPIIDLLPNERITVLSGGIHAGSFRWQGSFGVLHVEGVGWASRPDGYLARPGRGDVPARFEERRVNRMYQVAIWNGRHGSAYFRSARHLTSAQLTAIDRVRLFEGGEVPSGCN